MYGYMQNNNTFYTLFGLGCEDNILKTPLPKNADILYVQDHGEEILLDKACSLIDEKFRVIESVRSEDRSFADVTFALQCGGSDSFSALTANPLLGYCSTSLVNSRSKVILSETPEVRGFEDNLINLCRDDINRDKLKAIFSDWDESNIGHNNPAPGNYSGGISTHLEKSMGAILKYGFNQIDEVLNYAEIPNKNSSMIFMDSPGYDPCSISGQIASGATFLLFTTGRGSNYVNSFLPSLKIGSNTLMSERLHDIIDMILRHTAENSIHDAAIFMFSKIAERINNPPLSEYIHSDLVPWLKEG